MLWFRLRSKDVVQGMILLHDLNGNRIGNFCIPCNFNFNTRTRVHSRIALAEELDTRTVALLPLEHKTHSN